MWIDWKGELVIIDHYINSLTGLWAISPVRKDIIGIAFTLTMRDA
jgi:hypothetical protein